MTRFDGAASPTMREQIAIAMTQKASLLENTGTLAEAAAALRILTSQFGQDKEPAIQFVVAAAMLEIGSLMRIPTATSKKFRPMTKSSPAFGRRAIPRCENASPRL